jgi:hypothetical protein
MSSMAQSINGMSSGLGLGNDRMRAGLEMGNVYDRLVWEGLVGRMLSRLIGRRSSLRDLNQVLATQTVTGQHELGARMVRLDRIVGSEGRCQDFDRRFRPTQTHTCDRWYRIARARLGGVALPPVDLIQIGEAYYVRDGHHRISVARAFGDKAIEARVIAYELAPRDARQTPVAALAGSEA